MSAVAEDRAVAGRSRPAGLSLEICAENFNKDFSNGTDRLLRHLDGQIAKGCRRGLAPEGGEDDAALIALCRRAMRAIEKDIAAEKCVAQAEERYEKLAPPYPKLEGDCSPEADSSVRLRQRLKEQGPAATASWRRQMRAQIKAVVAWERETDALWKDVGLGLACRRCDRTQALAKELVVLVANTPAKTTLGCSWKSMVASSLFVVGYPIGFNLGEEVGVGLVQSILRDIRMTGGSNGGKVGLAHRKVTM